MNKNYRVIDLEVTLPAARDIPERVARELQQARKHQICVVKFIHGYGSTGRGGKLRLAVRRVLMCAQAQRQIQAYILGEQFSIFDQTTQQALRCCPMLSKDTDLERHNNGITLVLL